VLVERIRKGPFERYNSIGREEIDAAQRVLESGVLSAFVGTWGEGFSGGSEVQAMEAEFAEFFKVNHAISVNSWTSGLIAAVGALGLDPGDEVIVSTWTMSASATAILHWNLIPVFADIDPNTYCIDPDSVRSLISSRTKAIMAVDIFGQSSDTESLLKLCQEFNLKLISDSAQSPNALRESRLVGTSAHIGGISLNYHKHIHCGEGGVIFTNDDQLASSTNELKLVCYATRNVTAGDQIFSDYSSEWFEFRTWVPEIHQGRRLIFPKKIRKWGKSTLRF
jgi:dTDP-4-amino-4,6-dideoxygalactose transaminase